MINLPLLAICAVLVSVANADVQPQSQDDAVQANPNSWPGWPRPIWPRPPWRTRLQGKEAIEAETDKNQDAQRSLAVEDYQRQAADSLQGADFESWLRQRGQEDYAQERELNVNQRTEKILPEANNYNVVAQPMGCICVIWGPFRICISWRCGRRIGARRIGETMSRRESVSDIIVLGSPTEMKLYSDPADRDSLYASPVARAELVSRPLDPATPGQVSDALGGLQHAVVATLTDGRRFLVVKGNQKGQGSETIVILADHMTDDWTKVTTKDVSQSTLGDLVNAGGDRFDPLKDNGTQAAQRMMALP